MNIKEYINNNIKKFKQKSKKTIMKKIIEGTITEEEIIDLIVSKKIFKRYKGNPLIEHILSNGIKSNILDSLATTDLKFAIHYFRHNKFDILGEANLKILLKKFNNKTILDLVYEKFINNPNISETDKAKARDNILSYCDDNNIIEIAYRNNDFQTVLDNEIFLLSPCSDNRTDRNNAQTNLDVIIRALFETNKLRNLGYVVYSGKILTYKSTFLGGMTILEYLIDEFKEGLDWERMSSSCLLYMFDSKISILEYLIKRDKQQVINALNKIDNLVGNTRILQILKANNIKFSDDGKLILYSIPLKVEDRNEYMFAPYKKESEIVDKLEVTPEFKNKLEELRRLLMKSKGNDKDLIDLASNAFLYSFSSDPFRTIRDLQFFINIADIKKTGRRFALIKDSYNSSFFYNGIYIDNPYDINTFNHEFGHALHFFSNSFSVPSKFFQLSNLNETQIEKIKQLVCNLNVKLESDYEQNTGEDKLTFNQRLAHYLDKYYTNVKNDLETAIAVDNYPDEYVAYLTDNILTPDEFEMYYKEYLKLFRSYNYKIYDGYMFLLDIFDALSYGVFFTFGIDSNEENNIKFPSGHGIDYYFAKKNGHLCHNPFEEIIADYIAITKMPERDELINVLKDVMGKDFVDMLQEYYDNIYVEYDKFGIIKKSSKAK